MSSDLPATANCLLSLDHIVCVYQTHDWTLDLLCYNEPLDPIWRPDPSPRITLLTCLWWQWWCSQAHDLWQWRQDDDDRPTLHDRRQRPRPRMTTVNADNYDDHLLMSTMTMTTVNVDLMTTDLPRQPWIVDDDNDDPNANHDHHQWWRPRNKDHNP